MAHTSDITKLALFKNAPLYTIYSKILSFFSPHPQAIIILNASLIIGNILYCIRTCSKNAILSWYLYVGFGKYLFGMNAMRQWVAVSFVMMAYCEMRQKRQKRALLWILTAVGIHQTAIVGFFIFLMMMKPMSFRKHAQYFIVIAFISAMGRQFIFFFVWLFPHYVAYLDRKDFFSDGFDKKGMLFSALFMIFIIWKIMNCRKFLQYEKHLLKDVPYFYNSCCIIETYSLCRILYSQTYHMVRGLEYLICISFFLIPDILETESSQSNKLILKIFSIPFMILPHLANIPEFLPYAFFWQ